MYNWEKNIANALWCTVCGEKGIFVFAGHDYELQISKKWKKLHVYKDGTRIATLRVYGKTFSDLVTDVFKVM